MKGGITQCLKAHYRKNNLTKIFTSQLDCDKDGNIEQAAKQFVCWIPIHTSICVLKQNNIS